MNFHINDFEGPLDLLLHLVKKEKMDIYEIEVSQIIEEYLEFIHQMQDLNIDIASSYLVMAAELLHLKSKLLLNQNIEEDEENQENQENEEGDSSDTGYVDFMDSENILRNFQKNFQRTRI